MLFTNYQFYIDEFVRLGHEAMAGAAGGRDYTAFVEPGNVVTRRTGMPARPGDELGAAPPRLPQMPAYHLVRADRSGITMVNIGVGPANAKTITDHIAVLRPHAWMMLGHCAGLRNTAAARRLRAGPRLCARGPRARRRPAAVGADPGAGRGAGGAGGGGRRHHAAEGLRAEAHHAHRHRRQHRQPQLGAAARATPAAERRFSQSRAIALDMESATIAANGFRFRVPYGTLLCVSDKPLHGEIKLPGMANHFYRERVDQHLRIGIRAIELLREAGVDQLHSRKLRSFAEVAFQLRQKRRGSISAH